MGLGMTPFHGALTAAATIAAATAIHLGLRRMRCRLPLLLTQRRLGHRPTHPDAALDRWVGLCLLPLTIGLWLGAFWIATEVFDALRASREVVVGAVDMALTMPLFAIENRPYALRDVLALPFALGLVWLLVGALTRLVQARVLAAAGVARGAQETVGTLLRLVGGTLAAIVVLQAWGIDLRSLALVASVLGVGLGFGLQHLANNLVGGLVIGLERPVKPGDFVSVGDLQGTVERVGSRSVEIITRDRVSILVPNSHFLEQQVINWSHRDPTCRLHVPVGVAYGSDVRAVRAALLEAASGHPDVLADPPPSVALQGFGDSALNFDLEVWTRAPHRQRQLVSDLNFGIESAFRRHAIEIPFPQRDLRLRSPDLAAIALAFARRHLGDDALAAAQAALVPDVRPDDPDDITTEATRRTWSVEELDAVAARLHGPAGVDIGDRRHLLTHYRRCFVGREAVDWLVRTERLTRCEAVRLGQVLVERGVIHHVLDEHPFRDADLFYRFRADETHGDAAPAPVEPSRVMGQSGHLLTGMNDWR
jgi:small-conductance mechanosensitive channel